MKKPLFLSIIIGILIFSCSSTKGIKYFDENNIEISKSKFKKIRSTNRLLDIPGDSINHKKLIEREKQGQIKNRDILISLLEMELNKKIDTTKPVVIIYYPGMDPCNLSSYYDIDLAKIRQDNFELRLNNLANVEPIYIYKDNEGLKNKYGYEKWHKDPENVVEQLFFRYHYPCQSFVVISKNGKYRSYFGEYGVDYLLAVVQYMMK
jgi:hypothetical protein